MVTDATAGVFNVRGNSRLCLGAARAASSLAEFRSAERVGMHPGYHPSLASPHITAYRETVSLSCGGLTVASSPVSSV